MKEVVTCATCGSGDYGIDCTESDTGIDFLLYCKNCQKLVYQWGYPKPQAFGQEE